MRKIRFINSRFDARWSWELSDGRLIEVLSLDGKYSIYYDTPFNLETLEIRDFKDNLDDGFTTLNELYSAKNGKMVFCYDEYEVNLGFVRCLTESMMNEIIAEFREQGFNVTKAALKHNYGAWVADYKSGYRDDANGYFLFTPCGGNPLSFRATTLHPSCKDWQETYAG